MKVDEDKDIAVVGDEEYGDIKVVLVERRAMVDQDLEL